MLWILAFSFSLTTNVLIVKQAIYICSEMFIFDKSTVFDNKIKQKSIFTGEFLGSPHSQCSENCLYTAKSLPQAQICSSSYLMEFACVYQGAEFSFGLKHVKHFLERKSYSSDISLCSSPVLSMQYSSFIKWCEDMKCIYIWLL